MKTLRVKETITARRRRLRLISAAKIIVKRRHQVHFSSKTAEWATPPWLFAELDKEFHFTLDPCCTKQNRLCKKYFTAKENGLAMSWAHEVVYMNPPYGREIGAWMHKAHVEAKRHNATVVCLVPARTDTHWWHDYAKYWEVRFLRGRLKFGNAKNSAPFPSAVVVMNSRQTAPVTKYFCK